MNSPGTACTQPLAQQDSVHIALHRINTAPYRISTAQHRKEQIENFIRHSSTLALMGYSIYSNGKHSIIQLL